MAKWSGMNCSFSNRPGKNLIQALPQNAAQRKRGYPLTRYNLKADYPRRAIRGCLSAAGSLEKNLNEKFSFKLSIS
jgi:hypothetical protein